MFWTFFLFFLLFFFFLGGGCVSVSWNCCMGFWVFWVWFTSWIMMQDMADHLVLLIWLLGFELVMVMGEKKKKKKYLFCRFETNSEETFCGCFVVCLCSWINRLRIPALPYHAWDDGANPNSCFPQHSRRVGRLVLPELEHELFCLVFHFFLGWQWCCCFSEYY